MQAIDLLKRSARTIVPASCLGSGQLQSRLNSAQKDLIAERLPEESERTCLHGLRSRVRIVPS